MSKPITGWKAHAARDASLVALTLGLWRADAALRGEPGLAALAVGVLAGVLTAVCGYLLRAISSGRG